MTALEALNALLDIIASERTTIERQMGNVYPTPGGGFAYDTAKANETTQYDPSSLPGHTSRMDIETRSLLAGKLEYNGHVYDLIQRLIAGEKK
jgi:hypothetical protein